jgi:hypothetical protein
VGQLAAQLPAPQQGDSFRGDHLHHHLSISRGTYVYTQNLYFVLLYFLMTISILLDIYFHLRVLVIIMFVWVLRGGFSLEDGQSMVCMLEAFKLNCVMFV